MVFYIGMQKDANFYERKEYGMMDLISNAGGFISAIFKGFMVMVTIINTTNVRSKLMYLIYHKKAKLGCKDELFKNNIYEIQNAWFQLRFFIYQWICFKNRFGKMCCFNLKFIYLSEFYDDN